MPVPELPNRQVKPVPAVPMAYRAGGSPVDGKVQVEMTVMADSSLKVRSTRLATSDRQRIPTTLNTGKAMAGAA